MIYTVAVRALCEFTARAGDLDLRFTTLPSAQEGIEGHKLVQAGRGSEYESEVNLSGTYKALIVRGRADGWDASAGRLEEIKTYRGKLDSVRPQHRSLHWAQAKVYGHLLCQARRLSSLRVALVYFNINSQEESVLEEAFEAEALQTFFETQCQLFLAWAEQETRHRRQRDDALSDLTFPMPSFRTGQRDLAVAVYRATRGEGEGKCLLAQAPTGIGKTLGTMFPMLKAFPASGLDKLFFLTAKSTGHALALNALNQLGTSEALQHRYFPLRVLDLQARDKVCEHRDKACHGESCPLAKGFFDRLPAARTAMSVKAGHWDAHTLRVIALEHEICPYYLSQEMTRWSDVVVADYHYYYDTTASLYALTKQRSWNVAVLVDEAHNLVERARSMYSATLSQSELASARQVATNTVRKSLNTLHRQWCLLNKAQIAPYQSYSEIPSAFSVAVNRTISAIAEVQSDQPLLPGDPVLALYWSLLQFSDLAQRFGSHALFDIQLPYASVHSAKSGKKRRSLTSEICLRNVVPAPHLQIRHEAAKTTVMFSGTLHPVNFYRDLLGLPDNTCWLEVKTPFKSSQLQVSVADHISTRYRDRENSLSSLADLIASQYARRPGNYLCFFSSFHYLQQVAQALESKHPDIPLWEQTPRMDDESRAQFLSRFTEGGKGVGFAVLGGAFSEGVDLPGTRLIGAFIATLGLPQFNPVNDAMAQALDRHFCSRQGQEYIYLFPGLRKVVQAAGRVIRTESDQGVVVLIDDRYRTPKVKALLPSWWNISELENCQKCTIS